ncbi:MAG: hypothetical protein P8H53_08185 [Paracoccaceae bacterium]|nr:hypothetical protein [Paracoccaceae bacterium]
MSATYPRTLQTALLFDETAPLPSIDFDWQEVIDCVNEALFDYNKKPLASNFLSLKTNEQLVIKEW